MSHAIAPPNHLISKASVFVRGEAQYSKLGDTNDLGSLRVGGSGGWGGAGSLPQWGQLRRGHTTRTNALSAGAEVVLCQLIEHQSNMVRTWKRQHTQHKKTTCTT